MHVSILDDDRATHPFFRMVNETCDWRMSHLNMIRSLKDMVQRCDISQDIKILVLERLNIVENQIDAMQQDINRLSIDNAGIRRDLALQVITNQEMLSRYDHLQDQMDQLVRNGGGFMAQNIPEARSDVDRLLGQLNREVFYINLGSSSSQWNTSHVPNT